MEAEQLALLTSEKNTVEGLLTGKYSAVNHEGLYQEAWITFINKQDYQSGISGNIVNKGSYLVNSEKKIIEFDKGTSLGRTISYIKSSDELTLYGKYTGETVRIIAVEEEKYGTAEEEKGKEKTEAKPVQDKNTKGN